MKQNQSDLGKCQAILSNKKRCKNYIQKGNKKYCHVHSVSDKTLLLSKEIPFAEANELFSKLKKKSQELDISKTSKHLFFDPNLYWAKNPLKNGDVLGIDTPDIITQGTYDVYYHGLEVWIPDINKKRLTKKEEASLINIFRKAKISDAIKLVKQITNIEFLIKLSRSVRKTHKKLYTSIIEQINR